MKTWMTLALGIAIAASTACNGKSAAPATAATAAGSTGTAPVDEVPAGGKFIGRMWISATHGAPHGSFIIFLPDHTLLMGSCVETYRLSEWGVADDKIRWREDTIPVEASVSLPRPSQMELRLAGRDTAQSYVLASAPYVCPDLRK
jgi:hypothetical protein